MKKRCNKLSKDEIDQIRKLRMRGYSYLTLSKKFNCSTSACFYWCVTEEKRKLMIEKRVLQKRKTKRYPYYAKIAHAFYLRNRKKICKKAKKIYWKNRDKINIQRRKLWKIQHQKKEFKK